jgi:glyoxylase-like metal-dependent hydrolase (beta-lactamase superfamily II)
LLSFRLVQPGCISISPEEGVTDSRPTSSLLEYGDCRILIDTEHPKEDGSEFAEAFRRLDRSPSDVTCVIFTHLHPDHCGHKHLFPRARFCFHRDERMGFYFRNDLRTELTGSALLDPGRPFPGGLQYLDHQPDLRSLGGRIYIRHAPGHTPGSLMIFACVDRRVHAWVGDTFLNREYYEQWRPPGASWDQNRVFEHMAYARDHADVIIPGHGEPFSVHVPK